MKRIETLTAFGRSLTLTDSNMRATPICMVGEALLCYRRGMLCLGSREGELSPVVRIVGGWRRWLPRLGERILRLAPRGGVALSDSSALVSHKGRVLFVDLKEKTCLEEHRYLPGMSNPLGFSCIRGIPGFCDGVYYGEYSGNSGKAEVKIFYRPFTPAPAKWTPVYAFPAGSITHIHAILPDPYRKGVLVLTGDEDSESAIRLFRNEFREETVLAGGTQQARACVAFPVENGIWYLTDTPHEQNRLWFLSQTEGEWKRIPGDAVDGSCIYGLRAGRAMLYNTVVEPNCHVRGLRQLFTYRRGAGIADWDSKVYLTLPDGNTEPILRFRKDLFPMGLCQFGSVGFCAADGDAVWLFPTAVRGAEGKILLLEGLSGI